MSRNEAEDEPVVDEPDTDDDDDDDDDDNDEDADADDDVDMDNDEDADNDADIDADVDADIKNDDDDGTTAKSMMLTRNMFGDDDEGDDDDDEGDDENYLQKLDADTKQNIVSEYHPELSAHNTEEVETMCMVVRDVKGRIVDPLHRTVPFVTRYEKARVVGERAKQINSGAKPFVEIDPTMIDGYLIALKEFEEKKIPFIIRRPLPNGGSEYWRLSDLEIIA